MNLSALEILAAFATGIVMFNMMIHQNFWVRTVGYGIALILVVLLSLGLGMHFKTCAPEPTTWYM